MFHRCEGDRSDRRNASKRRWLRSGKRVRQVRQAPHRCEIAPGGRTARPRCGPRAPQERSLGPRSGATRTNRRHRQPSFHLAASRGKERRSTIAPYYDLFEPSPASAPHQRGSAPDRPTSPTRRSMSAATALIFVCAPLKLRSRVGETELKRLLTGAWIGFPLSWSNRNTLTVS